MRRDDGLSPGDHGDPVADSIRRQQQRDAMPSKEELAEAKKNAQTCDRCGEMGETVKPRMTEKYIPECKAMQGPGGPPDYVCDDCWDPETKADVVDRHFREGEDYVVEYGCGRLMWIDKGLEIQKETDGELKVPPHPDWSPSVDIQCRCGKVIENVYYRGSWGSGGEE